MNVARSALLTAQHWFDKGVASLAGTKPIEWETVAEMAFPSLDQALTVIGDWDEARGKIAAQLDATRRAMDLYFNRMTPRVPPREVGSYKRVVDKLRSTEVTLRAALDLPMLPAQEVHKPASKHDDVYEAQSLGATLDLIAFEARTTLERARSSNDATVYRPLVLGAVPELQNQLAHALSLSDAYGGTDKAHAFAARIQIASIPITGLRNFITTRLNDKALSDQFAVVEARANRLRAAHKLEPLGGPHERAIEKQEHQSVDAALLRLDAGLDELQGKIELGANRFYELAKLEDPQAPGSLWTELAEGLIVALIGNVVGAGIGRVMKGLSLGMISDEAQDLISGSASDTLQSWSGAVNTAKTTARAEENERIRDALFFRESLLESRQAVALGVKTAIAKRIEEGTIATVEINAIATELLRQAVTAKERTYQDAARKFALFLARRGLGGTEQRRGKEVSKIGTAHEYFIGDSLSRAGKRDGTEGIARISVELDRSGPTVDRFQLLGMNSDMANAVLGGASRRINKLGLPTEIEIAPTWSRLKWIIVVDEAGELRTSTPWNEFRTDVPALGPIVAAYGTPAKAWDRLREVLIPSTVKVG